MFDWLRKKIKKDKERATAEGIPVEEVSEEAPEEEPGWVKFEREKAEQEARDKWTRERTQKEAQEKVAGERAREELEAERRRRFTTKQIEEEKIAEELERLSPRDRKRYEERIKQARRGQTEAAFEIWESGIPEKKTIIQKTWNPTTQQHEFKQIQVPMSPQERLAEARVQKLGGALIEEELSGLKQRRRERSLPYRAAKGAVGFGQFMAGTAMLGTAGVAQAMQPGRGGPQRAERMHAPGLPLSAYQVGVPSINLSGLRGSVQPKLRLGGLEHLKGLTLPRRRQ